MRNIPHVKVKRTLIDRAVGVLSPRSELNRLRARAGISFLDSQGYITSGSRKRSMRGWYPSESNPDNDIIPKLGSIRASARDLFLNTPVGTACIRRVRTNVIGFGLFLQSRIDRDILRLSDDAADVWERNVEREFNFWASSKKCDATLTQNLYDMQATAFLGVLLDGDVVVLLPRFENVGDPYLLKVKVVSGDQLANPPGKMETKRVSGGIEVNEMGAPIKYYLKKTSLDAEISSNVDSYSYSEIAPYNYETGTYNLIHLFDRERPNQRRGVSILAPVIEELKNLTRLSKAELDASILNAFFTVFVKSSVPGGGLQPGFPPLGTPTPNQSSVVDEKTPGDEKMYELGSGNIIDMDPDEEIQMADPKRPNQAFEPFFDAIVRQIGASLEIPAEQLMLNFRSSYSAARGAMLEAWKLYRRNRIFMARNFCQPIYSEWLMEAVARGTISAPGYFEDPRIRDAWEGSTWAGLTQGQIDPERETRAALLRIEGNLSTHEDEYTAIHGDSRWVGAVSRKAREKEIIESRGLTVYTRTRQGERPTGGTREHENRIE